MGEMLLTAEDPKGMQRGNPGVESCKSIFFGVDLGEGWYRYRANISLTKQTGQLPDTPAVDHPAVAFLVNDLALL